MKPRSWTITTEPGKPDEECDAYTCAHHNGIVLAPKHPKPGDDMDGYCPMCHANICGPCADEMGRTLKCIPFEKRLDKMESKERAVASMLHDEQQKERALKLARQFGTDRAETEREKVRLG